MKTEDKKEQLEELKMAYLSKTKFLRNSIESLNLMPSERQKFEEAMGTISKVVLALESEITAKDRSIKVLEGTIAQIQDSLEESKVDRKAPIREEALVSIIENCRSFFQKIRYPHLLSYNHDLTRWFLEANRAVELYRRNRTVIVNREETLPNDIEK